MTESALTLRSHQPSASNSYIALPRSQSRNERPDTRLRRAVSGRGPARPWHTLWRVPAGSEPRSRLAPRIRRCRTDRDTGERGYLSTPTASAVSPLHYPRPSRAAQIGWGAVVRASDGLALLTGNVTVDLHRSECSNPRNHHLAAG